jgi:hypothetical protein
VITKPSSVKKQLESLYGFPDEVKKMHYFKVYFDNDIGFNRSWTRFLKTCEQDDDVMTDDGQLYTANQYVRIELKQGISAYKKNSFSLKNYKYMNKDYC